MYKSLDHENYVGLSFSLDFKSFFTAKKNNSEVEYKTDRALDICFSETS